MVRAESDGKYTPASRSARLRSTKALRSSAMPALAPSATKSWRKAGIVARAVAPSRSGATGTSRQPRTVRPSSAAIVSIRETASVVSSAGRKAMPTAYAPASGSSKSVTSREEGVRYLEQDAGAVARVGLGAGGAAVLEVAQYGQRLLDQRVAGLTGEGGHEPDATGVVLVTGVVHPLRGGATVHGRPGVGTHRLSRRRRGICEMPRDDVGPLRNFVQVT